MLTKEPRETIVFITGASKGIGFACAKRFAELGYQVIATSRAPEDRPELLDLGKKFPNLTILKLDVTDSEENITSFFDRIGEIDILINNAGIGLVGTAESFSRRQIDKVYATNLFGLITVTNAVLPGMRKRNAGLILTISSIVGPLPDMRQGIYSGSKSGGEHFLAQLKRDLADNSYNITIANIHPGPVVTEFEASTPVGERFDGDEENPYPHMSLIVDTWRNLMRQGRPVEETVDTVFRVIDCVMRGETPAFWNPTEARVADNFAEVYKDPSGSRFAQGPIFPTPEPEQPAAESTLSPILSRNLRVLSTIEEQKQALEKLLETTEIQSLSNQQLLDVALTFNEFSDYTNSQKTFGILLERFPHEKSAMDNQTRFFLAHCYYGLANAARELSENEEAIAGFIRAREVCKLAADEMASFSDIQYDIERNLGIAFLKVKQFEKAQICFANAVQIAEKFSMTGRIPAVTSYWGLSLVLSGGSNRGHGLELLEKARGLYPAATRETSMDWAAHRFHMGLAHKTLGDYIPAISEFSEALRLREQLSQSKIGKVYYHNRIGDTQLELGHCYWALTEENGSRLNRYRAERYFSRARENFYAVENIQKIREINDCIQRIKKTAEATPNSTLAPAQFSPGTAAAAGGTFKPKTAPSASHPASTLEFVPGR